MPKSITHGLALVALHWVACGFTERLPRGLAGESPGDVAPRPTAFDFPAAQELLTQHCGDCHDGEGEGGFSLDDLASPKSLASQHRDWRRARARILDGSMPPRDVGRIPIDRQQPLIAWIDRATLDAVCGQASAVGPPIVRRLAKHEYSNTIRDLLGIHVDAGNTLPQDAAGGEGFNNAAETLTISPIHAEKYLEAAAAALRYAARSEVAREHLFASRPGKQPAHDDAKVEPPTARDAARTNLHQLASRAFRRPVDETEVERWLHVFDEAMADGLKFEDALTYAMRGILASPQFLFISESLPAATDHPTPLSDHELATRLSYFLWATMPDDELRDLADQGTLKVTDASSLDTLRQQTLRLLQDESTHLRDSMDAFVGQWLGTADLGRSLRVDRESHPDIKDPEVAAMRNQPVYSFEWILRENAPLTDLIECDWAFLNNEINRVYDLRRDDLKGKVNQQLRHYALPDSHQNRGGLVGMSGVLAVSSYPRRSSPVLRGTWVQEKLLGVELPPPPPDVPALDESADASRAATLRERLEIHRADSTCATCHDRIDPIGFALENFDEVGRWRESDAGGEIDSTAELADGTVISGVKGLKSYLMARRDDFVRQLTRKMLGYALGRGLTLTDQCTVDDIVHRIKEDQYRSHALVLGIVESDAFTQKQATNLETSSLHPSQSTD